jgi:hypothetical protein
MIEHKINKLDNFIMGFYPNDISICDEIIEFYNNSQNKYDGVLASGDVDKNVKHSTDVGLLVGTPLWSKYILQFLQPITNLYINKYPECNMYSSWTCMSPVNIQHYKPNGGFFKWHCERLSLHNHVISRHLVFMTYLNDVTDGGETEFYHQKLKVKPERGLTLIWPTDWTFTHRGVTSPSQDKMIVTGWYNYS